MKFKALAVAAILLSVNIYGANYFPLSVGNIWYYSSSSLISSQTETNSITSDTTVGNIHYYKSHTVINTGTTIDSIDSWQYISGNDVYATIDLTQPDQKTKIAQLTYKEGDTIYAGLDTLSITMVATSGGTVTVPAKTYKNTWKLSGSQTVSGANVTSTSYFADGVGLIKSVNGLSELAAITMVLDSVKLSSSNSVIKLSSNYRNFNSITADGKGFTIYSPADKQTTVSVFTINGKRIVKKAIPTNSFVSYDQIGLGWARGQYILSAEKIGNANLKLP